MSPIGDGLCTHSAVSAYGAVKPCPLLKLELELACLVRSTAVQQSTDPLHLCGASVQPSNCVCNLGVIINSGLTLLDHIIHITNECARLMLLDC